MKKDKDHDALQAAELADVANFKAKLEAQKAEGASAEDPDHALTDEEIRDKIKQEKWTEPEADNVSPEFRRKFIRTASFGALDTSDKGPVRDALYWLSGVNWTKVALFWFVIYCIWVFLLVLSVMGTGFKLLGGKDSAKMFDVVDNPISGVMIGILATVLVQSSSTTTSTSSNSASMSASMSASSSSTFLLSARSRFDFATFSLPYIAVSTASHNIPAPEAFRLTEYSLNGCKYLRYHCFNVDPALFPLSSICRAPAISFQALRSDIAAYPPRFSTVRYNRYKSTSWLLNTGFFRCNAKFELEDMNELNDDQNALASATVSL